LEWLVRWMEAKHGLIVHLMAKSDISSVDEDVTVLLFQATRELLFNVVKHAGVKTASVEVTREGTGIRILVADKGAGFDPKQIRAEGGGTGGFGLFSLRERLDLLGGRVEIDSMPGRGSRFTLVAPLPRLSAKEAAAPGDVKSGSSFRVSQRRDAIADQAETKIRVLLVDDHVIMRQGLAELLHGEKDLVVVGEAADGESAMELVRDLRPAVVLMDIDMPGLSGIDATRIIHAELPGIRIIGLSMFEDEDQAAAMRKAGAVAYFSKSAASVNLIAAIRACVGSPKRAASGAGVTKGRKGRRPVAAARKPGPTRRMR